MLRHYFALPALALLSAGLVAVAEGPPDDEATARPRDADLVLVRNDQPAFMVRVTVDHPDLVYRAGDELKITVRSEKDGHLYVLYKNAAGKWKVFLPNDAQSDNKIKAGVPFEVPPREGAGYKLVIKGPPFGEEVVKALVTTEPIEVAEALELSKGPPRDIKDKDAELIVINAIGGNGNTPPADGKIDIQKEKQKPKNKQRTKAWAEHNVVITTVAAGKPRQSTPLAQVGPTKPKQKEGPRRVAVFVGISQYQSPQIRKLRVSHIDAEKFAEAMNKVGGPDDSIVMLNEKATLKELQKTICEKLPAATKPGDTVFIYWLGHGGQCADTIGGSANGMRQFLVPYDGNIKNTDTIRDSMVMDTTFARWIQELDGRKVVIILDTCHSGGQAKPDIKDPTKGYLGEEDDESKAIPPNHFLEGEMEKFAKAIDQKDVAVLASCQANEPSFERRERDLSVMTFFALEKLRGGGPVTLKQVGKFVEEQVPAYVKEKFPGATQTPICDDKRLSEDVYLTK
jgi:hypothetical protein